jgi:hypothetical protein
LLKVIRNIALASFFRQQNVVSSMFNHE